jgi:hypothetical protein
VRRLEEEQIEAIEEVSELIEAVDVDELRAIESGLAHIERALDLERKRVIRLDDGLEVAIELRREKRREAWEDVRAALRRFGPSVLDVVQDVVLVATSPREERIALATTALLDHAELPIPPGEVTRLAKRIVDALED